VVLACLCHHGYVATKWVFDVMAVCMSSNIRFVCENGAKFIIIMILAMSVIGNLSGHRSEL